MGQRRAAQIPLQGARQVGRLECLQEHDSRGGHQPVRKVRRLDRLTRQVASLHLAVAVFAMSMPIVSRGGASRWICGCSATKVEEECKKVTLASARPRHRMRGPRRQKK